MICYSLGFFNLEGHDESTNGDRRFVISCKILFCCGRLKVIIPLPKELAEKERSRLEKELEKVIQNCERVEKLLSNRDFLEKAHPQLIEKQKTLLTQAEQARAEIQKKLSQL